jgi:hypothetical protein
MQPCRLAIVLMLEWESEHDFHQREEKVSWIQVATIATFCRQLDEPPHNSSLYSDPLVCQPGFSPMLLAERLGERR